MAVELLEGLQFKAHLSLSGGFACACVFLEHINVTHIGDPVVRLCVGLRAKPATLSRMPVNHFGDSCFLWFVYQGRRVFKHDSPKWGHGVGFQNIVPTCSPRREAFGYSLMVTLVMIWQPQSATA